MAKPDEKPKLTRVCPLCGCAMRWCGDVPTEEEPHGHYCHHLTCIVCKYNVDFWDEQSNSLAEFPDLLRHIAGKWNR